MTDPRIKTAKGPTILLASGHYFDLLDPGNSRFTMGDIARGLGNACRFAGQCDRFYSVEEHTWLASFLVPQPLAFAALMHDAPEALIGDVTRPLKSLLPAYKQIEQDIAAVIAERFLLGDLCEHPLVKRADVQLLAAEQQSMMPAHDDTWHCLEGVEVPAIEWKHWLPADAAQNWLNRATTLIGQFPDDVESLLS